jgi:hypothetical protein
VLARTFAPFGISRFVVKDNAFPSQPHLREPTAARFHPWGRGKKPWESEAAGIGGRGNWRPREEAVGTVRTRMPGPGRGPRRALGVRGRAGELVLPLGWHPGGRWGGSWAHTQPPRGQGHGRGRSALARLGGGAEMRVRSAFGWRWSGLQTLRWLWVRRG